MSRWILCRSLLERPMTCTDKWAKDANKQANKRHDWINEKGVNEHFLHHHPHLLLHYLPLLLPLQLSLVPWLKFHLTMLLISFSPIFCMTPMNSYALPHHFLTGPGSNRLVHSHFIAAEYLLHKGHCQRKSYSTCICGMHELPPPIFNCTVKMIKWTNVQKIEQRKERCKWSKKGDGKVQKIEQKKKEGKI